MATAQYRCPHCGKSTGVKHIYKNCQIKHRCSKCRQDNLLKIEGHQVWRLSQVIARKGGD